MEKPWAALLIAAFMCLTIIIMQQCHYNHLAEMKCMENGGVWINERCIPKGDK